jgi:hypothetical protein
VVLLPALLLAAVVLLGACPHTEQSFITGGKRLAIVRGLICYYRPFLSVGS